MQPLHNIRLGEHASPRALLHGERLISVVLEVKMQLRQSINLVEYVVELVLRHPH
jgi:hypothetical protein